MFNIIYLKNTNVLIRDVISQNVLNLGTVLSKTDYLFPPAMDFYSTFDSFSQT